MALRFFWFSAPQMGDADIHQRHRHQIGQPGLFGEGPDLLIVVERSGVVVVRQRDLAELIDQRAPVRH